MEFSHYNEYGVINEAEEDALTITEDEVVYKLGPDVKVTAVGTEESSGDPAVPEPLSSAPVLKPEEGDHSSTLLRCWSQ